jgi:hypothetical protein
MARAFVAVRRYSHGMTISPPLTPGDDAFNALANRLAGQLSSAFDYSLAEAENHIRDFYLDYQRSIPETRKVYAQRGVTTEPMTAKEVFWHEDSALVLEIGYRLAGGDIGGVEFLEWRKGCWDVFISGKRVPTPDLAVRDE